MPEIVVLRAADEAHVLVDRFLDAVSRDADVDLVCEGWVARLLPEASRRLALGGRDALASMAFAPLFPKVFGLLLQAHKLGRTWRARRVAGAHEVVLEIRRDLTRVSRER